MSGRQEWSIITIPGARRERLPYGIRNSSGFICFFSGPTYFDGQDQRYAEECEALRKNADIMCAALNNA